MPSRVPLLGVLFGLILVLVPTSSALAHPVLQGAIRMTVGKQRVTLQLRETLRPAVLSSRAAPRQGSFFSPEELELAVRKHAEYLLAHLRLRSGTTLQKGRVTSARFEAAISQPVHRTLDIESLHALYEFEYPLDHEPTLISLEQDVLSDIQSDGTWRTDYVIAVSYEGHSSVRLTGLVTPESGFDFRPEWPSASRAERPSERVLFGPYVRTGIHHILTGWDHLLFVSALVVALRRWLDVAKVIVAFTAAHSMTLALAALGLISLPDWLVEPLIALSIILVSVRNLMGSRAVSLRERLAIGFGFGLVHGLGFAGPLIDALQKTCGSQIAKGILAFSLGVEIGHQLVVIPLVVLALWFARHEARSRRFIQVGSALTALGGIMFLVRAL